MKKFTTQSDYERSGQKGLLFLKISKENVNIINKQMKLVDNEIVKNNRTAVERAKKIVLNR